jgi:CTP:phosphocholine cytidylyltransferase-like protein
MKRLIILLFVSLLLIGNAYSQTANFTYRLEGNTVTTTNTSILQFSATDTFTAKWYFRGDGTSIYERFDSASFRFFTGGSYQIILSIDHLVKTQQNPNNWVWTGDTIEMIKTVNIGGSNFFSLSGNIQWRGENAKAGTPYLLKIVNGRYQMVRYTNVSEDGFFQFDNLTTDTFVIWTLPSSCDTCKFNASNVLPTYSGNTVTLDSAEKLIPTANITNYTINLLEASPLIGNLVINGKVTKANIPTKSGIILSSIDKSKFYRFALSDSLNGNYTIKNIEAGTYLLQPTIDGVPYLPLKVTISADSTVVDINLSTLTTQVTEQRFDNNSLFSIYPNPFADKININKNNQSKLKSISVSNSQGQLIFKSEIFDKNELDLSNLNSGLYFVTINNTDGESNTIKILKN